ncbi:L,D-transpeptidase-like protein [Stackebrandtia albiflava]|uniref:L,D-transpeptidase-like protein n=1 Tax=Stackebrandtia albiflava TaxID=406432 RepID=A0A562ULE6_9ACTN|nr:L,D-transpeptidase family protein [Stackebrandtia albiflava]TWJ06432.1 L,D-transpeptidase-like protein [Stackebrandtia albiflava]
MKIRRPIVVAAALAVALTVGVSAFAWAGSGDDRGVIAEPVSDTAEPETDTETPEPDPQEETQTATPTVDHDCGDTGPHQKQVEEILADLGGYGEVFVDGEQSREDCEAITEFQERMGISPAEGHAGDLTRDVAVRIHESDLDKCDPGGGIVVCIDLTHQTLWVTDVGEIVYGPTIVRTGMAGQYKTQTGKLEITNRAEQEWSKPYKVWLPYWQHFYMGQGLHETTTYIHDSFGSHGCVNLLHEDAVALYEMLDVGDVLHIFGNKPGT